MLVNKGLDFVHLWVSMVKVDFNEMGCGQDGGMETREADAFVATPLAKRSQQI